jgi:hypothetical protein
VTPNRVVALAMIAVVLALGCVPVASEDDAQGPLAAVEAPAPTDPLTHEPVGPEAPGPRPSDGPRPRPVALAAPRVGSSASVTHEGSVSVVPRSVDDRAWEPVVATHPTDPDRVAVVYQHRGPGAACRLNPTVRISHDGGRTWHSTKAHPTGGSRRGASLHAAIAWGPSPSGGSRLYWANMTVPSCGDSRFSLTTTYSDDEGATWSKLRVERDTPPWVGGFPEIVVDRDPASPNHGVVYVAYNWLPRHADAPGFRLLASSDFGDSWQGADVALAPQDGDADEAWRIAYRLRPAPDGSLFASWYQVDLRRWDRANILAKGGPGNVARLGVAMARVTFDRDRGHLDVGPSRMVATVRETAFTTTGASAQGTGGNIRPDPMWQHGFDIDPTTGRLYVAVAGYGPSEGDGVRGAIRVGRSDDAGKTWTFSTLPRAPDVDDRRQSSIRPNLVAGPGFVLVTFHTLDDAASHATVGASYALSTDGAATWQPPQAVTSERWRAEHLGGVVNGVGLRERAERSAGGDVFWAYGDGRHATSTKEGRVAIYGARIEIRTSVLATTTPGRR